MVGVFALTPDLGWICPALADMYYLYPRIERKPIPYSSISYPKYIGWDHGVWKGGRVKQGCGKDKQNGAAGRKMHRQGTHLYPSSALWLILFINTSGRGIHSPDPEEQARF